jgi:adenylate kinase
MPDARYRTVLFFGVPGVGKGTQGRILSQIPGVFHCASGDIFRSLDPQSAEAQEANSYTAKGNLVPDELTLRIWRRWIEKEIFEDRFDPRSDLLLLDGIPRNVRQCEMLENDIKVMRVIYLAATTDAPMIARIKHRAVIEDRADDTDEEVIRHRFEVYRQQSAPVLDYYPRELRSSINPMGTVAEVLLRILMSLIPVQNEFLNDPLDDTGSGI